MPKRTLFLLFLFIAIVALIGFVVWKGFLAPNTKKLEVSGASMMEISLDLSLLESEKIKKLRLFEKIPETEKQHKRSNPFSPYGETNSESESD